MSLRIALGGSACNPPHIGHLAMVRVVRAMRAFDLVRWDVCGARVEKPDMASAHHRVAMTERLFATDDCVVYGGNAYGSLVPTIRLLEGAARDHAGAEVVWCVGVDLLVPQERFDGRSEVAASWVDGERLLREWPCLVLPRRGYPHPSDIALPFRAAVLDAELPNVSSTDIRMRIAARAPFERLVTPAVADYIKEYGLYGWRGSRG